MVAMSFGHMYNRGVLCLLLCLLCYPSLHRLKFSSYHELSSLPDMCGPQDVNFRLRDLFEVTLQIHGLLSFGPQYHLLSPERTVPLSNLLARTFRAKGRGWARGDRITSCG